MTFIVGAATAGCASTPPPRALTDAERTLVGPRTDALRQERPALIEEAESFLRRAKRAQEAGETEDAVVLAQSSSARYRMADDLVAAAKADVLAARLSASLSPDEQRQLETDRFLEITDRIDALVQRLDERAATAPPDPIRDEAKAALLEAREKQSEAIGEDAPRLAPVVYAKAVSHIGTAVESLELASYRVSLRESQRAQAEFARAMSEAKAPPESDEGDAVATTDADPKDRGRAAEKAIVRAKAARARAESVPGATMTPDFAGGSALLEAAVSSFEDEVFDEARSLAGEAKRNFDAAAKTKPPKDDDARVSRSALGPRDLRERTEEMLVAMQLRRAELIGAGADETCRAPFGEFQAVVALAKERLEKNDVLRAWEFTIRAQERIKRCERSMAGMGMVAPASADETAPSADDAALRAAALSALQAARVELASARRRDPRSALLTAGRGLLNSAQTGFDRGGYREASALAGQAQQILRSVKAAASPAARVQPPPPPADAPVSAAQQRAESAVGEAAEAQLAALERGAKNEEMASPDRLLTTAQRSLGAKKWTNAARLAARARGQYERLARGSGEESGDDPTCRQANAEQARLRSTLLGPNRLDASRRESARSLFDAAQRELDADNCRAALSLATEARRIALPGAAPAAAREGASPSAEAPPVPTGSSGAVTGPAEPWRAAFDAIDRATSLRDQARARAAGTSAAASFNRGVTALGRAQDAYRAKNWEVAERQAKSAARAFESVPATPAPAVDSSGNETVTVAGEAGATRAQPAPRGRVVVGGGEPWRKPYFVVYRALEQRRAAEKAVTDATKPKLEEGTKLLGTARKLWDAGGYDDAAAKARRASTLFAEVLAAAAEGAEGQSDGKEDEEQPAPATREEADAALREAKVVQKLCQRDDCRDRDFEALTRAEEAIASAQSAFEATKYGYAVELAEKATASLNEILAKPRKSTEPPPVDPELKAKAEEALRTAEVQQELCAPRACEKIDLEAWLLAQKDLSAAKSARADGDFERAARLAAQAEGAYRAIEKTAPEFVIPDDAGAVKRSGDQLYVSPAISFASGSTTITPASQPGLEALAKVLIANASRLEKVDVLGFTDNSGNAALNKQLSARRAKSVRAALIRLGVPADILAAEGRGEEAPIADNTTAAGRKANRRVEVHFVLKKETP
ncbi:MAG: OmpA family protein [Myxococcota bacterium]